MVFSHRFRLDFHDLGLPYPSRGFCEEVGKRKVKALVQRLCEGGEVVTLLQLAFASSSRLRKAAP
jgi:hypothetical protein